MELRAGTRLGAYEIVSPLGAGGMGEVYKARDTRLGRMVAVKVLPAALAADAQFRERFDREAQAISHLTHPNICTLFDVGHQDGTHFLVMELLDGETLAARLQKGALPVEEIAPVAGQIADALDCAHSAGIVHRDLKPANVFLTRSGVKLLDFGLAKSGAVRTTEAPGATGVTATIADTTPLALTAQGTILGTLQYMAPEQVEGRDADARADIWAFGAILHEMITGRQAFAAANPATLIAAVLTHQPPLVSGVRSGIPRGLDTLVAGCLEKDRERRWQNVRDLRRQLTTTALADEARAPSGPGTQRTPRGLAIAGAAALLLIGAAIGFGVARRPADAPAARLVRFEIRPPAGITIPHFADTYVPFAPSPDGTRVAYTAGNQLWIQSLDSASFCQASY